MIISNKQLGVFSKNALDSNVDALLLHVETFFPQHYLLMGEPALKDVIRYGFRKAKQYGFQSVRNSCLYLNNMLLLGSNFDTDPQYSLVKEFLVREEWDDANRKIDDLSDEVLRFIESTAGARNTFLYRAWLRAFGKGPEMLHIWMSGTVDEAIHHFQNIYPRKAEVVGADRLKELVQYGRQMALKYRITDEPCQLVYVMFMFLLGSGFDTDGQFEWAGAILTRQNLSQEEKVEQLYRTAVAKLSVLLS